MVRNFRVSTLSSLRKLKRVYAYWWTLAYCYDGNADKIIENLIASYCDAKNYWRANEKEIDFIVQNNKKIIPIEVKKKKNLEKTDINHMSYFLKKYKIKKGYFTYNGEETSSSSGSSMMFFMPFWKWLLDFEGILANKP